MSIDIVIEAGKPDRQYWKDLWRYRELFFFLAWRDILVRYKQTAIGIVWGVLRPFLVMVVFTILFGKLGRFPSDGGAPYPILVYTAMLPWYFFSTTLHDSTESLIVNESLISKVYMPRFILPVSSVVVNLVDFFISAALLAGIMTYYRFVPGWKIVFMPALLVLAAMAAMGLGLLFSALNVKFRDFRYVVPFVIQLGLYISPVGFSSSIIPEKWRLLYSLNPMVGVIDGFRWALLGGEVSLYVPGFLLSIGLTFGLLFFGVWFFRRAERTFADVI
jgi:lipopolysaccharide transport system permease protein